MNSNSGAAVLDQLQAISKQVQQIVSLVTASSFQINDLVSMVQGLTTDFQSFNANSSIASAIFNSGPASNNAPGSILSCPNPGLWTNNILFGNSGSLNLQEAITGLLESIQGTSAQAGVNLVGQIFNQAGGNDCSSSGCNPGAYTSSSYVVPGCSPACETMQTLNQVRHLFTP